VQRRPEILEPDLEASFGSHCLVLVSSSSLPTLEDYDWRSAVIGHLASCVLITKPEELTARGVYPGSLYIAVWVPPGKQASVLSVKVSTWSKPVLLESTAEERLAGDATHEARAERLRWKGFYALVDKIKTFMGSRFLTLQELEEDAPLDSDTDTESSGQSYLDPEIPSVEDEAEEQYQNRRERRRQRRRERIERAQSMQRSVLGVAQLAKQAMIRSSKKGPFDLGRSATILSKAQARYQKAMDAHLAGQPSTAAQFDSLVAMEAAQDETLATASALMEEAHAGKRHVDKVMDLLHEPEFTPELDPAHPSFQPQFALTLGLSTGVELLLGDDPPQEDLETIRRAREAGLTDSKRERSLRAQASLLTFSRATTITPAPHHATDPQDVLRRAKREYRMATKGAKRVLRKTLRRVRVHKKKLQAAKAPVAPALNRDSQRGTLDRWKEYLDPPPQSVPTPAHAVSVEAFPVNVHLPHVTQGPVEMRVPEWYNSNA
jgi:hypothetical protein